MKNEIKVKREDVQAAKEKALFEMWVQIYKMRALEEIMDLIKLDK